MQSNDVMVNDGEGGSGGHQKTAKQYISEFEEHLRNLLMPYTTDHLNLLPRKPQSDNIYM